MGGAGDANAIGADAATGGGGEGSGGGIGGSGSISGAGEAACPVVACFEPLGGLGSNRMVTGLEAAGSMGWGLTMNNRIMTAIARCSSRDAAMPRCRNGALGWRIRVLER